VLHREEIPYPNGENGADVWNGAARCCCRLVQEPHEKVAIVGHMAEPPVHRLRRFEIAQQKRFPFGAPPENCSITVMKYIEAENQYFLYTFNDFSHLKTI
jgi:broad specificity phosphatase PhoE